MKKKTFYTTSAIIAAIAAIFFGVPALKYKSERKKINTGKSSYNSLGVPIFEKRDETFFEYVKRYWKELFVKPLQTANNGIDTPKEASEEQTTTISLETQKAIQELFYGPNPIIIS